MPLGKNADAGDYVDDFKKSKAPQFKGKSDKKRRQMAIAAFLDARRKKKLGEAELHHDPRYISQTELDKEAFTKSWNMHKKKHNLNHPRDMKRGETDPDHIRNSIYKHANKFRKAMNKESVQEAVVDFDSPGMLFKVSVEGLPDMFMAGRGPSDIKAQLRKIVKQPSMIKGVKRMPKTAVKKMFRDIFQGREEEE